MVGQKSKRRKKRRYRECEDLIRRSPVLSSGAKLLWIELLRGWTGDDLRANVSQSTLAIALGKNRRSIIRWQAELVNNGLIKTKRTGRALVFTVVTDIPESICPPDRLNNSQDS